MTFVIGESFSELQTTEFLAFLEISQKFQPSGFINFTQSYF